METANFFKQLANLNISGDLHLTIAKGADNNLIVLVNLQNEQCGDNAKKIIPPLHLRGTAEELDNGFFEKITEPIEAVSGLMDNMEAFLKQVEQAKAQSAMVKSKAEKEKKETDTKDKKFNDAMAKVNELEKAGKPKEAWMLVPKMADFPEHAETLRRRKSELSAKFAPDLFAPVDVQEPPKQQEKETAPSFEKESQSEEENDFQAIDFDEDGREDEY